MQSIHYLILAIGIYLIYTSFKPETLENVTTTIDTPELRQYVAERVADFLKENPNISFNTFQSIMRDNSNQHKNLEDQAIFAKLKSLGSNITTKDVLDIL